VRTLAPIASHQEFGTLLVRFGIHGAEINPAFLRVSPVTNVDEMPPVRQEGRTEMKSFLARGINGSDLNGNTARGGHPDQATQSAKDDHAILVPCPPPQKTPKMSDTVCEGPPVASIFLSFPWNGYPMKRLSGTRMVNRLRPLNPAILPTPGNAPTGALRPRRPVCGHRAKA